MKLPNKFVLGFRAYAKIILNLKIIFSVLCSASNWFICGFETLLLGGACATVAYTVGQFVDKLVQ